MLHGVCLMMLVNRIPGALVRRNLRREGVVQITPADVSSLSVAIVQIQPEVEGQRFALAELVVAAHGLDFPTSLGIGPQRRYVAEALDDSW